MGPAPSLNSRINRIDWGLSAASANLGAPWAKRPAASAVMEVGGGAVVLLQINAHAQKHGDVSGSS